MTGYEHVEIGGIGFRYIKPYEYVYTTYCKERWQNKPILDIFTKDFKAFDEQYYFNAIVNGSILVNGLTVEHNYIVKNGDCITHKTIRREPLVLDIPIAICADLPNILVVNKPPSIPCHPTGMYNKNTLVSILENDFGYKNLNLIHRLDRVTSGTVIMAKNAQMAKNLTNLLKTHTTEKWYVARVKGNFPYSETEVDAGISCKSHKEGIYQVDETGKASRTYFKKKGFDPASNQTVVYCRPFTGRTHQIRVHLMHLGYPIANDVCYGGEAINQANAEWVQNDQLNDEFQGSKKNQKQLEIWLHAFRYKLTQNLDFRVPLPLWAEIED
ncbi:unnamed protein product [Blepharisma stoltei]|uniref:Pseudouridine synthase n=1 Tax=Blepharisma stoltei TaxID=1481888 RepID=A0AAU9JSX5_9CILI|nr:unnamed protein product [Blepharisma stoltei]